MVAWVDTAFNGTLVVPRKNIAELRLTQESVLGAILADGNQVELECYACFIDWFGETYLLQVVANDGDYPLLGTMLLDGRRLTIDYTDRTLDIE